MSLQDYLKKDPVWQKIKRKSVGLKDSDRILTRVEFLKLVKSENYNEQLYRKYVRQAEEQQRKLAEDDQGSEQTETRKVANS